LKNDQQNQQLCDMPYKARGISITFCFIHFTNCHDSFFMEEVVQNSIQSMVACFSLIICHNCLQKWYAYRLNQMNRNGINACLMES